MVRASFPFVASCAVIVGCTDQDSPTVDGGADATADADGGAAMEAGVPRDAAEASVSACTNESGRRCAECHKTGECRAIDNPCNEDSKCNAAENAYFSCLCFAKVGTGAAVTCDDNFKAQGGAKADPVIDCLRTNCTTQCY
jgi:hypothetical protein